MPNQPKTAVRTVRIPAEIWDSAVKIAEQRGETVSDVLRACLARYVRRHSEREQR